jgi:hypothetical protein
VREPLVAPRRCDIATADSDLDEFVSGVQRSGDGHARLDHDALQ